MNFKPLQLFLISLGLTTLTTLATASIYPTYGQSNSSAPASDKVTFLCREVFDKASGKYFPATVAWVPERKDHVRFIIWKSDYFNKAGWTAKQRCEKVTERFQKFYEQNSLKYLSHGMNNGEPIICALANQGESCNGTNQLFTIKNTSQPDQVLQRLVGIGESESAEPLLQNSGDKIYVSVAKLLQLAPLESL